MSRLFLNPFPRGYDHRVPNRAMPGQFYAEALYVCHKGFEFDPPETRILFCSEGEWVGRTPNCVPAPGAAADPTRPQCKQEDAEKCHQLCYLDGEERPRCECHEGFEPDPSSGGGDASLCIDVDECAEDNGGCDDICVNKPGTFMCGCSRGFQSRHSRCLDVNECLLNNGHGPCQDTCHNSEGGYSCSCEGLPGTALAADNHTCESTNGCNGKENGGCSHICIDSYNQVQ